MVVSSNMTFLFRNALVVHGIFFRRFLQLPFSNKLWTILNRRFCTLTAKVSSMSALHMGLRVLDPTGNGIPLSTLIW